MGNCACSASRHAASWSTGAGETVSSPGQEESGEVIRTGGEVTIRVSKRRLQELMVKTAVGGEWMTAEEKALAEILNSGEVVDWHRRRWEPELQSIPEAAES